jgi:2-oxo-4-hydroxy-4-carboxy-5-ureidoimidazoline decarboxylase
MFDVINALSDAQFVGRFGFLFEYSPWVAARAAGRRPFANAVEMRAAMIAVMAEAREEELLALLRAHPRLADKVAQTRGLTQESAQEQASAGLDRLSPEDYACFHALNEAYDAKFGFPFIICVRLTDKDGILAAMARRLENDHAEEFTAALVEIGKIVDLRLADALAEGEMHHGG